MTRSALPLRFALTAAVTLLCRPVGMSQEARWTDHRKEPLATLQGPFPFTPPATEAEWTRRSDALRLRLKVALGLHPLPTKTPLHAVVHGWRDCGDFRVGKVILETAPGFFLTGNLYEPAGLTGKAPGVLCPHGHFRDGRFMRATDAEVEKELAIGAEKDPDAARNPLQARCVHLARMGCVVFHYDMTGYADNQQLPAAVTHLLRVQRPEMNRAEGWGLYSPQAEGQAQSVLGIHTWNSIRALDFLTSLPEVDAARVGVTGASGGGTQTFLLGAVDPRPAVSFPAVMVTTAMQGGCTCENASLLRVTAGNVEIAALFAPKPLGMTTADDWTKEMPTKGYPQLQSLYALLGATDKVGLFPHPEFPHNYNLTSRLAMYAWLAKHLQTPKPAPAGESPWPLMGRGELTVWDAGHPAPEAGNPDTERRLLAQWAADARAQIAAEPSLIDEALPVLAGRTWAETAGGISWEPGDDRPDDGKVIRIAGVIRHERLHEEVRCAFLYPKSWNGRVEIRLGTGEDPAAPSPACAALLADGTALAFPTLFTEAGQPDGQARHVENDRENAIFTLGYNQPVIARRAHDILTLLAFLRDYERKPQQITLTAGAAVVPETALALTQVPAGLVAIARLAPTDFRFAGITSIYDPRMLPGAVKYGDLPAILARGKAGRVERE